LIVAGSDDLQIRVYNYNTMEKVKQFEAHTDYIRYILVHPTQPYLLTSSDDSTIKLWDVDKDFVPIKTLEDHVHYVMMLALNPRDPNTFASASLDKTIKVWSL
jgi:coatomer subunit beta'